MDYTEVVIPICEGEERERLIALLSAYGVDAILEDTRELIFYLEGNPKKEEILTQFPFLCKYSLKVNSLLSENWQKEWERHFPVLVIQNELVIYPPFKKEEVMNAYPHLMRLEIYPGMAFGTGHHDSTRLMLEILMSLSLAGKKVIDVGCGTGILGLYALKKGAKWVTFLDIDPNAVENTYLNLETNQAPKRYEVILSDLAQFTPNQSYDLVLANIQRNPLIEFADQLKKWMAPSSELLLSGILIEDASLVEKAYKDLVQVQARKTTEWICLHYRKP